MDLVPELEVPLLGEQAFGRVANIANQALLYFWQAQDGRPFLIFTYCGETFNILGPTWVTQQA